MPESTIDRRREAVYAYVGAYVQAHGYSPSIREIAAAVGTSSTSSVRYHLQALERDGRLTRCPHAARTWRVAE